MDWFDVVVHVGMTITAGVIVTSLFPGSLGDAAVAAVVGGSLLVLGIRRQRLLARMSDAPADVVRVDDLEARVGELEKMQFRVAELEERLDFAERMLGQQREPERLPRG